jgi:hypothetical protein
VDSLTPTEITIALAAIVTCAGYVAFIVAPAWASYGRLWERVAAGFLTVFMLATLLGFGTAIGFAIVWFYDRYA